jgi:hypothetical protein
MPLEDLEQLGFTVNRVPEGLPPGDMVQGFGRQWTFFPGGDEAALVTEAKNHKKLYDKMTQALEYFSGNYANWPTMTNQQKDTAMRQSQRAIANMIRVARGDLSSEGD